MKGAVSFNNKKTQSVHQNCATKFELSDNKGGMEANFTR